MKYFDYFKQNEIELITSRSIKYQEQGYGLRDRQCHFGARCMPTFLVPILVFMASLPSISMSPTSTAMTSLFRHKRGPEPRFFERKEPAKCKHYLNYILVATKMIVI